jgi:ABC-type Fe3+/spermidine/putrescine transport system ATPase subunit
MNTSSSILSVTNISKRFGSTKAVNDVSLEVTAGEIIALLGPSGCGKSTLLFLIAGLETPDQGDVIWEGVSIKKIPPHLREFGLMFQDFALFPHMNVYANVAFGLKMARMDKDEIDPRVQEMLGLVGLHDFAKRDVSTLSGGEQQRAALARALAPHPHLLMLDEPLGSLDSNLRQRLVTDLQAILKQMNQTAIYVTHDQEEAFTIADRVVLMNAGRIEQSGTPQEIYSNPSSLFVARFLEMNNFIEGEIHTKNGRSEAITSLGSFLLDTPNRGKAIILVRPDGARMDETGPVRLSGVVKAISFRGSLQRITLLVNHQELTFDLLSTEPVAGVGADLTISLNPQTSMKAYPAH